MVTMSEILGENFDPIAEIIDQADFDDDDRDTGTSGLCGTFALALHKVLKAQNIASTFVFFSPKDQNGQPRLDQRGYPFWSHVAVKANGKLYDIDGHVLESHCISNYCWDHKHGGVAVPADSHKASAVILATKNAFDQRHFDDWRDRLSKTKR